MEVHNKYLNSRVDNYIWRYQTYNINYYIMCFKYKYNVLSHNYYYYISG